MKPTPRDLLALLLSGLWINASEFLRNQFLLNKYWVAHYQSLGLTFPQEPKNGMLWMVWGFSMALMVLVISRRFGLLATAVLAWFMAFVLMWLVIGNLGVLSVAMLVYAVPLSMLEAFGAAWVCTKISPRA